MGSNTVAPSLFSMMLSTMLIDAFHGSHTVFPIRYRFDGKFFNPRRLQAKTRCRLISTVRRAPVIPARSQECKGSWIKFHNHGDNHVITMYEVAAILAKTSVADFVEMSES